MISSSELSNHLNPRRYDREWAPPVVPVGMGCQIQKTGLPVTQGIAYLFFQAKQVLLVTSWPYLESFTKSYHSKKWRRVTPVLRFYPDGPIPVFPAVFWHRQYEESITHSITPLWVADLQLLDWSKTIPPEVLQIILQFPRDRWQCLSAAAKVTGWINLAKSHPALAYLVANCHVFDGKQPQNTVTRMKHYISLPGSEFLHMLGFRAGEKAMEIIQKLSPSSCTIVSMDKLRRNLNRESKRHTISLFDHSHDATRRKNVCSSLKNQSSHPLPLPTI